MINVQLYTSVQLYTRPYNYNRLFITVYFITVYFITVIHPQRFDDDTLLFYRIYGIKKENRFTSGFVAEAFESARLRGW